MIPAERMDPVQIDPPPQFSDAAAGQGVSLEINVVSLYAA